MLAGVRRCCARYALAEIADSGQSYGGHAYHDCLDTAAADHAPVVEPRAGIVWRTHDGVTLTFIGPSLPFIDGKNAINDNSVAFILQYLKFRMLFTGDAGVAAERRFLERRNRSSRRWAESWPSWICLQLVAGIHRCRSPAFAIISVGRHNLFGHPAPSTIETLEHFGARVYRTDENAATMVLTDGLRENLTSLLGTQMLRP